MVNQKTVAVCSIFIIACFTDLACTGFFFLTSQYAFFRFKEDEDLFHHEANAPINYWSSRLLGSVSEHNVRTTNGSNGSQKHTANFLSLLGFITIGLSIVSVMNVGYFSDRYGRRRTIGIVLLGQGISFVLTALVIFFHQPLIILYLGSVVCGLVGGGYVTLIAQLNVCLADLTSHSPSPAANTVSSTNSARHEGNRLLLFGLLDALTMVAGAVGYGSMGLMIQHSGFYTSTVFLLVLYIPPVFMVWLLPETNISIGLEPPSVPSDVQISFQSTDNSHSRSLRAWFIESVWSGCRLIMMEHPTTLLILLVWLLFTVAVLAENQFRFLYLMSEPFAWSTELVGIYNAVSNIVMAIASIILLVITVWPTRSSSTPVPSGSTDSLIHIDEGVDQMRLVAPVAADDQVLRSRFRRLIYVTISFLVITISKTIMGVAYKLDAPGCNIAAGIALSVVLIRAAVIPTLKSLLSSLYPSKTQGRIFSVLAVFEFVGLMIGQAGLPSIYAATLSIYPGITFFLSAVLALIAFILLGWLSHSVMCQLSAIRSDRHVIIKDG